jgi:hypothetical protein
MGGGSNVRRNDLLAATWVTRQLGIGIANSLNSVRSLQTANHKMPFRRILEMVDKQRIDNRATGGANYWNRLNGCFFGDGDTKSRSDLPNQAD